MSLPVGLRRVAQAEFDAAADWYDPQQPGLGADFIAEVRQVLNRIGANPHLYAEVHRDIREALVQRFPYAVY
jgi:toxin ParE1/3/4